METSLVFLLQLDEVTFLFCLLIHDSLQRTDFVWLVASSFSTLFITAIPDVAYTVTHVHPCAPLCTFGYFVQTG